MTTAILIGVVSTLTASAIVYGVSRWRDWRGREVVTVELDTRGVVLPPTWRLGMLFVRDGEGRAVNREHYFEPSLGQTTHQVRIRSTRTGFEYKCFVDHEGCPFAEVETILTSIGMVGVRPGRGRRNRAWFLRPGEKIVQTTDAIANNFFYVR
jgi:hypothetical protein